MSGSTSSLAIAANSAVKAEGNSGFTAFTFTVSRSGATNQASTANWRVTGFGTNAAVAADFAGNALPTGVVSFASGDVSKVITVWVVGENVGESDEDFTVALSNASAGTAIDTAAATGTIQNDDVSLLAIAATSAVKVEGDSGSTAFTFTVTRTGATNQASTANWEVTGSVADPATASDFTGNALPSGIVSFGAGVTSQTITIPVSGDTTVETNEGFTVSLSNPSAGTAIDTAAATGTIQNDDASLLAIAATSAVKAEGNSDSTAFTFTVTRTGATNQASTANWAVTGSGGNPAGAADFAGS